MEAVKKLLHSFVGVNTEDVFEQHYFSWVGEKQHLSKIDTSKMENPEEQVYWGRLRMSFEEENNLLFGSADIVSAKIILGRWNRPASYNIEGKQIKKAKEMSAKFSIEYRRNVTPGSKLGLLFVHCHYETSRNGFGYGNR